MLNTKSVSKHLALAAGIFCLSALLAGDTFAQGQAGGPAGGAGQGGFQGGDGQFGAERVTSADAFEDNRNVASSGDQNFTLGGGQAQANNMNFLNALFGGGANNNVNQNTPLRGRSVRAPFRLGFKFEGATVEQGLQKLNARILRLPRFKDKNITAVLQEKTLLLVGEVASQEESALAARIAGFEPGVDQVKNLLAVAKQ